MKRKPYIFLFLAIACATVKSPTGGEKDVIPPNIVSMSPVNYSTNFSGDRIIIEFDEYVQLKDLNNQLLVSPPLEQQPEFVMRGKQVIIQLQEGLRDSTTYTFNLGEGIVDNNEGNVLDSNVIVFSTGAFLDSLQLKGSVYGAFNDNPQEVSVMLYEYFLDTISLKEKPTYFAKTNEQGMFKLSNLRAGEYTLMAIKDNNKNYLWEPTESLAFLDSSVTAYAGDSSTYNLRLFKELPQKQFVKEYSANKNGKAEIKFNLSVDSLQIEPLGFSFDTLFQVENETSDSLVFWFKDIAVEGECFIKLSDRDWIDTIPVFNFEVAEKLSENPKLITSRDIQLKEDPLRVKFNQPISSIDNSNIFVSNRTDTLGIEMTQISPLVIEGSYEWKEGTAHQVIMYPGFVTDIYGNSIDTLQDTRIVKMNNYFSELILTVQVPKESNYILELVSEDGTTERMTRGSKGFDIMWNEIPPGKYNLRLIDDANNNGQWDTGNFKERSQPERVFVMYDLQKMRSNWVLEQNWEVVD